MCLRVVYAHDLGVYGSVFPINEVSIAKVLAEQASKIDWHAVNQRLLTGARQWKEHLPSLAVTPVLQTRTVYFDPSITLHRDIIINGHVLYKKGMPINPLDYIRPTKKMLFFDGNSAEQWQFVLVALHKFPMEIMPVMVAGNPVKYSKKIKRPVYYAFPPLMRRFHITHVPTLMGVGKGAYSRKLAITTFASPFDIKEWVE